MDAALLRGMRGQTIGIVLLLLLVMPLQNIAAQEDDSTLEAREAQAEFLPDLETTVLRWRNIATSDVLLLDQLKMATYEVHRSESGRFYSNSITPETIIAEDIPACYMNDLNEVCSGKYHSLYYEPEPGTQSSVSYAIVTVLRDGTRTEAVTIGMSQTPMGHLEIVAESVAPEQFTASYDVVNQSTVFSWRPSCPGTNFFHALYEHSVPATKSTWDSMDVTLVTNFIPASASTYSIDWTNQSIDRSVYYTLTCFYPPYCEGDVCYQAREDTRLHSGNTLAISLQEDNQAPRYGGSLSAQFNPDEDQTVLQWSEVTQPDISKIRVYHAPKPIVSLEQSGIQVLAELEPTSVEFIHHLPSDWMLTSYYAIGLIDTNGNIQVDQFDVSGKVGPIIERNLPISIASFAIQQQNSTLHFQWELDPQFLGGEAVLWTSSSPNPDMTPSWEPITRLNPNMLEHHITFYTLEEGWYALTLEGTWGSSPSTHTDDRIYLGSNAVLFTPSTEEAVSEATDDSKATEVFDIPDFKLMLDDQNLSLSNGDWVTLESTTNGSFTLKFTHSQENSTIRWTDALNSNPFWSSASKMENEFSLTVEEPTNYIHIESTNVNDEIHIVRIGIDWPDEQTNEKQTPDTIEPVDEKHVAVDDSVSFPLLAVIAIISGYILIIFTRKPGQLEHAFFEEE